MLAKTMSLKQRQWLEPYACLKQVFTHLPKATTVAEVEALLPFKPEIELDEAA